MIDPRITKFLNTQTVAGIACLDEKMNPYCFSCFYAFDEKEALLIFKSSNGSSHTDFLEQNPSVAGTVNPDKLNRLAIKGIQFRGVMDGEYDDASRIYHKRYPFALAMKGEIWTVRLTWIKMTDQSLGFGKKIEWERERERETETETERVIPL